MNSPTVLAFVMLQVAQLETCEQSAAQERVVEFQGARVSQLEQLTLSTQERQ